MPCCYSTSLREKGGLALWRIEESAEELQKMCEVEWLQYSLPSHPRRQAEQLASRLLLYRLSRLAGQSVTGLYKTSQGAPYLVGSSCRCSISHDWPYAAAILHTEHAVGVDVAERNAQALQVRNKFLSKYELSYCQSEAQASLYWAAKEAAYKYTEGRLKDFKHMRLQFDSESPDGSQKSGRLRMRLGEEEVLLGYFWLKTHVVVYLPLEEEVTFPTLVE